MSIVCSLGVFGFMGKNYEVNFIHYSFFSFFVKFYLTNVKIYETIGVFLTEYFMERQPEYPRNSENSQPPLVDTLRSRLIAQGQGEAVQEIQDRYELEKASLLQSAQNDRAELVRSDIVLQLQSCYRLESIETFEDNLLYALSWAQSVGELLSIYRAFPQYICFQDIQEIHPNYAVHDEVIRAFAEYNVTFKNPDFSFYHLPQEFFASYFESPETVVACFRLPAHASQVNDLFRIYTWSVPESKQKTQIPEILSLLTNSPQLGHNHALLAEMLRLQHSQLNQMLEDAKQLLDNRTNTRLSSSGAFSIAAQKL